ncbi:MAG TPA: hypothetical protein VHO69_11420 [Phototrophicaceae bacterium]|nr:hypothetical protein [Phototrophicaceae bacterium]
MRGRERLFATLGIWTAFIVVMNNLIERFTRVSADFTGLWPSIPMPSVGADGQANWDAYNQIFSEVQNRSTEIFNQVTTSINQQMATNMGPLIVLALAMILAAVLSTYFVWRNAHLEAEPEAKAVKQAAKTKRSQAQNRVELVLDNLDAGELAELRARLETAETEPASFEDLLARRDSELRLRH